MGIKIVDTVQLRVYNWQVFLGYSESRAVLFLNQGAHDAILVEGEGELEGSGESG